MHPDGRFRVEDRAVLLDFLRAHPFVTIAAAVGGRPFVAQSPVVIRDLDGEIALDFHLSRGNVLTPHLTQGFRAVVLATGLDAYISPDWYESADQVPTWNYQSVEAEGSVAPLNDAERIRELLEKKVDLVIDGGAVGSDFTTVIDLTGDQPVLLRRGKGDITPFGIEE